MKNKKSNIHLVMPFTRFHLLDTLIKCYEPMDIIWHPIMFEGKAGEGAFDKPWIDPLVIQDNLHPKKSITAYFKVNYFIKHHTFIDEDYYCFSCDDDMIEDGVYDAVKQMDDDIVIISLKRGDRIPVAATWKHGTNTLYADPSNVQINSISAQQSFVKGKIFKEHLFNEGFSGADGEMAIHYKESGEQIRYEPDLFVMFNYYEPGRWGKPMKFGKLTSIIIPCHNQADYTKACIESIQANTDDYEIIIVDNGSTPSWHDREFCVRHGHGRTATRPYNTGRRDRDTSLQDRCPG